MDTKLFLSRILPVRGFKMLATPRPQPYKGFKHYVVNSIEEMAERALELNSEQETVYYACAGFAEEFVMGTRLNKKTGLKEDVKRHRTAENASYCKSFWVDLDVDEDDELKYESQAEAIADLKRACAEANLPAPMLVSSGYGIHAYWPLTEDIAASTWYKIALRFKALLNRLSVKQDNTRTADPASVLRPVGVTNWKYGAAVGVELISDTPDVSPTDFTRAVIEAIKKFDVTVMERREKPKAFLNGDLISKVEYPPSSALKIVDKCAALNHFRTVLGDVDEPFWRASLGLIKHTVEGEAIAHEWSKGHPSYDKYDTQEKLDLWAMGPPLCSTFECYGKCEGCPVKGKIKSPIQLGTVLPEQATAIEPRAPHPEPEAFVEHFQEKVDGKLIALPQMPEDMRDTFRYTKSGNLIMLVPGDDETPDTVKVICQEYIVPFAIIRPSGDAKQGNRAIMKCWRFTLSGMREEITVPMSIVSTGGKDFVAYFGDMGILIEDAMMRKYMRDWARNLKTESDDAISVERMGWAGDAFVIGQKMFTPTGTSQASLASNLQNYQKAFTVAGDAPTWTRLINDAYNREGQEQYQFIIACGFGSVLMPFVGDYRGVIVSAVSYKSGQGKTTTQKAALSIYGDPNKLETAFGRQTQNALYEKLGAMGNLPFILDEVSNIEGDELSAMAYAISQGVQKDRLTKNGDLRAQREAWQTIVLTSGNRSLISALGAKQAQREAEMRRIFEFKFESVADLKVNEADKLFKELANHYGCAGEVYLDYIVRNRDAVKTIVNTIQEKLASTLNLTREERFWGAAMTAAMSGLFIANKLGLVGFTVNGIMPWLRHALTQLRQALKMSAGNEFDLLNAFLAELQFDLYVTQDLGDRRGRSTVVNREPRRGKIGGRLILDSNTLLLRPEYVRDWCEEKRADPRILKDVLIQSGCMAEAATPARDITGGILGASPLKGRLWEIDNSLLEKIGDKLITAPKPSADNVVPIKASDVS